MISLRDGPKNQDATVSESGDNQRFQPGDARAIARLSALCGLDALAGVGLVVDVAERVGDSVRLHVTWDRVGEGWIRLRRAPVENHPAEHGRIRVVLEGDRVERPFAYLLRRIAAALGDTFLDVVLAPFGPVAGSGGAPQQATPINSWGGDDGWRQFLCDHAMERKQFETFRFDGPNATVTHGDIECRFITPRARFVLPRFFNYPEPLGGDSDASDAFTDLGDLDVIEGGQTKLDEMVRSEVARMGDRGPVFVNSTCVPVIIGDDVDMVLAECRGACAQGLFHVSARTVEPVEVMIRFLDHARERAEAQGRVGARPDAVALVGFPEPSGPGNLAELLESVGIPVAGSILPDTSEDRMSRVVEAGLLVCNPGKYRNPLIDRVFRDVALPRIAPEPPWGIGATAAWLRTVAQALGRVDAVGPVVADLQSRLDARTSRQASGRRPLGFVIAPGQEERLLSADSATGLPVLRTVRDLGFPVQVAIWAGDRPAARDSQDRLTEAMGDPGVAPASFATPDELERALGGVAAVYSEFFYDDRLTRRGWAQFSAGDFRMGFSGAVWSLERLQRLVELPFYARYGSHFGAPFLDQEAGA